MAKKPRIEPADAEDRLPELRVPIEEARSKLIERINMGDILKSTDVRRIPEDYEALKTKLYGWSLYNEDLLRSLFSSSRIANEYKASGYSPGVFFIGGGIDWEDRLNEQRKDISYRLRNLQSVYDRLELFPHAAVNAVGRPVLVPPATGLERQAPASRKVFVVHGHDEALRERVARFLEKLDLEPVILHEQPSEGRTIIEKIDRYADVHFAIVLMTADDEGRSVGQTSFSLRARQNVILELGFFLGRLGRSRVLAIYEDLVEIPSDFGGVVYEKVGVNWQLSLVRELKAAGFDVDANRAI